MLRSMAQREPTLVLDQTSMSQQHRRPLSPVTLTDDDFLKIEPTLGSSFCGGASIGAPIEDKNYSINVNKQLPL